MENDNILSGSFHKDEDTQELSLRPTMLDQFIGQKKMKNNLSIFIEAARKRKEALDHVFLSGPPGLGKTTIASVTAHEMGAEFKSTSAPAIDKPKDLAGILTTITEGSVFFIDEIHRLKPALEEMLYTAMEDYELDWVIGQGPSARSIKVPIPKFTLIGATTKAGAVSSPLYSRFGITFRLNFYENTDIEHIIRRSSDILEIEVESSAVRLLAKGARGTPRVANRLLRRMRDFAQVIGSGRITEDIVAKGFERLEIDDYGLEHQDREILKIIITKYNGGPVGAETLAISAGEAIDTLEDLYEPYLIQRGFVQRTPRGRVVTPLAYTHLNISRDNEKDGFLF
ncbi:MAG: Holliday junction branch migration DNA helicase RuvB [Spirochaetia bacterium]